MAKASFNHSDDKSQLNKERQRVKIEPKYTRRTFYMTNEDLAGLDQIYYLIYSKDVQFSHSKIIRIILAAYLANYPEGKISFSKDLLTKILCDNNLPYKTNSLTVDIPKDIVEGIFNKFQNLNQKQGLSLLLKKAVTNPNHFYKNYILLQ